MNKHPLFAWLTIITLLMGLLPAAAAPAHSLPAEVPQPAPAARLADAWYVAGDFNGWSNNTDLLYDDGTHGDLLAGDGIYSRDYAIATAGRHQWKVTDGTWAVTYPAQNSWFYTTVANQVVKFTFDTNTYTDGYSPSTGIVNVSDHGGGITTWTAVGDWQNWNPGSTTTRMKAIIPGVYVVTYTVASAGTHEYKVAKSGTWTDDQFGAQGREHNAPTVKFVTSSPNQVMAFYLDLARGRIKAVPAGTPGTAQWYLRGTMNGWSGTQDQLSDDGTHGDLLAGDGIYSLAYTFSAGGEHEWKITVNDWSTNYPSSNAWLSVGAGQTVLFTLDTNTYNDGWQPATNIVNANDNVGANWTAVGDWQSWNNSDPNTKMQDMGLGQYVLTRTMATPGAYMYKAVKTGTWHAVGSDGRGVDASNVEFQTYTPDQVVGFFLDAARSRVRVFVLKPATHGHDGVVDMEGLYHNSRDEVYRLPFGAVPVGTEVTLRLRAFKNDLTGARLRVVDDVEGRVHSYPMQLVASDDQYDYWEYTLPTDHATLLWYRFEAIDGAARAYYGDESNWWNAPWTKGGAGRASGSASGVGSFQLTVYLPDFTTPDWLQNGVIYQIFPERFRNGDPTNDVISGTFFYGNDEPWGTPQVHTGAVTHTTWNEEIYDPRQVGGPYFGAYSNQFYGGDLQGVIDKLDYLRNAGFTVLYFNPIFTSPSNHKYDGTTYEEIDPALGDMATFTHLITEAQARGMHVILDGVFNHTSSDSVYFDKYSRYATTGAYESQSSPYYNWYFFTEWPENYVSWWGFQSLPKLNSANPEVRSYIYSGTNPIATRWLMSGTQRLASGWRFDVAGDIDPGYSNAPDNGYWIGFRQAVRAVYSQTAMISEEWGNASQYLLGNQMDSTMNYRFRNALLGFIRDTGWSDTNTSFPHQTPSQFFETMKSLQEDYPAPAWYAMMNLVGTHDTNRVRFVIRESGDVTETVDARQQLMALAQYSLPGAPTVYYADEVGASADGQPCSPGSTTMCGDPYNRLPFPWDDTPGFYSTRPGMLDYYTALGYARHANAALRTGSLDLLQADDDHGTLAYGRKGDGEAALALFNRSATTQTITLDLTGYLPVGTVLTDVLSNQVYTATPDIQVVLRSNRGALLVTSGVAHPPTAPANLTAAEGNGQVVLNWEAVTGAASYNVYRSLLSGAGYTRVATGTTGTVFTDTTVTNGTLYYYVVTAVDNDLLESGYSNEASALPHAPIGWAGDLTPASLVHTIGLTPTAPITAQVRVDGVTNAAGQGAGITAQLGYGLSGTLPSGWAWTPMSYAGDMGDNDVYSATLTPEMTGTFQYAARFSTTGGRDWTYTAPGLLTVNASSDTTPPDAPTNLRLAHWGLDHLTLAWDAPAATDVYAYDLYRATAQDPASALARVLSPTLVYTDATVASGLTYTYTVVALDTSFNFSAPSNEVAGTPRQRTVTVTFNVTVPAFTPADATICIPGDNARIMGSTWDPSTLPMTQVDDTHWTRTVVADDGIHLQYKYTRCRSWDVVEWWGNITGLTNRQLDIVYGADGVQIVNDEVGNWRDPLVMDTSPPPGATDVLTATVITATWSRALDATTVNTGTFKLEAAGGPVIGVVSYISRTGYYATVLTPTVPLDYGAHYTATLGTAIKGRDNDNVGLQKAVRWSFTTLTQPVYTVFLPVVLKNQ